MFTFSFSQPWLLLLLVVPAALAMWVWFGSHHLIVLPFDHGRQRQGKPLRAIVNLAEMLPAVLLAVAIFILAGPLQLSEPKEKRVLTNIEFCVDISGSMTASFGDGSRYDASMKAIDDFLDYREGDAFGLTFFGHNVLHWAPLTSDTSALRCAPPFMRPEKVPPWFGGTKIGKALLACREVLVQREEGDRMIVLVSDGSSADLYGDAADQIARKLTESNVVVYAVHIADSEIPDPVIAITSNTGGEVFNPGDPEALQRVFQQIDKMQMTRIEKAGAETMDNFLPFCVAGLSVLGMCTFSLFGLRYTPW